MDGLVWVFLYQELIKQYKANRMINNFLEHEYHPSDIVYRH